MSRQLTLLLLLQPGSLHHIPSFPDTFVQQRDAELTIAQNVPVPSFLLQPKTSVILDLHLIAVVEFRIECYMFGVVLVQLQSISDKKGFWEYFLQACL